MFSFKLNGVDLVKRRLANMAVKTNANVQQQVILAAFRVQATAKRSIQNSPPDEETGRSIPGNPPKTDTGRLVNSIFVDSEEDAEGFRALVGTNVEYGRHLEFGTKSIEPRPWLQPALEENREINIREVSKAVSRAARGEDE
jgi:HK97 gp10 family phage protein